MEVYGSDNFSNLPSGSRMPLEIYGGKDDMNLEMKRCLSANQDLFSNIEEISQFIFMDDKARKSIVAYIDGRIDIINTDDGKVLYSITQNKSAVTAMEMIHHEAPKSYDSKVPGNKGAEKRHKTVKNIAQKFLLPIEFTEATKAFKRKLKYYESLENASYLFCADKDSNLSIYLNGCFPVAHIPITRMIATDIVSEKFTAKARKIKAAKDLSKLFMEVECDNIVYFLTLDTRFLGYKSGLINDVGKQIYESFEFLKFIENKTEECTTFWMIAQKKYNAELGILERAIKKADKSKQKDKKPSDIKEVTEELRMLHVYSVLTPGMQSYITSISKERKELAKREEVIQNELDKIENLVTNFIMPSIETMLLKLSGLRALSETKERYEMVGLSLDLINKMIEKMFYLFQKYEEINLAIVEAK